jgi:hypothetical protein
MNRFTSTAAILIVVHLSACGNPQGTGFGADLREELLEMVRADQLMRERVVSAIAGVDFNAPPDPEWIAMVDEQNQLDEANNRRLEQI